MSITINVAVTLPLETFAAVREIAHPEDDHELVNQVAYETTYTIIDAIRDDSNSVTVRTNGGIHCRGPRMLTVRIMKLSDGKFFDCDIPSNATGRELACRIHDDQGIPLLKQVLMFHGNVFFRRDSDRSIDFRLDQTGISDGSKIVLGWRF